MHILLTRPLEDSQELILRFKKLGHEISHMPLVKIEKKNHENLNFYDYKGIIFKKLIALFGEYTNTISGIFSFNLSIKDSLILSIGLDI